MKKSFYFFCLCLLFSCGPDPRADGKKIGELRCKYLEYTYKAAQNGDTLYLKRIEETADQIQKFNDYIKERYEGKEKEAIILMRTCDTFLRACPYHDMLK